MEVVELARESLNPELRLLGILLNLADMRTVHSREALVSLQERFGDQVFDTVIRSSIAYAESAERARSILDHRPDLGADYLALAGELLDRLGGLDGAARARRGRSLRAPRRRRPAPRTGRAARSPSPRLAPRAPRATAPVCS